MRHIIHGFALAGAVGATIALSPAALRVLGASAVNTSVDSPHPASSLSTPSGRSPSSVLSSVPSVSSVLKNSVEAAATADQAANIPYDGRYTLTRIRYTANQRGNYEFFGDRLQVWEHDYPRAERHLAKILSEVTGIVPDLDASNIFTADDARLDEFPIAYFCEAGYWGPTEKEVVGMRNYMLKGGFVIFDDFRGGDWGNFLVQLHRVLPGIQPVPLDVSHPIFHSFFDIRSLDFEAPTFRQYRPVFYGLFQDNDPKKHMMAIINYDNDVSEYWEWSDQGFLPIDLSNEAYKLGINYIVYAMTH